MCSLILATLLTTGAAVPDQFSSEKPLGEPREEKKAEPADKGKPLTTMVQSGNRLTITSDNPQVLAKVQTFFRRITESPTASEDFQVFKLTNADAVDVAPMLDELFNGRRQSPSAAPTVREDRVRVVPNPTTNSLLVKANPVDMLTIRKMLRDSLDTDDPEAKRHLQIIGPFKYARAREVAAVLRDIYRENINPRLRPGQTSFSASLFGNPHQKPADRHQGQSVEVLPGHRRL